MSKQTLIIGGVILLIIIILAVPRDIKTSKFTVNSVSDGNTLVLENGYEIVLLGVQGNEKSQDFLKGYVGKSVRMIMDTTSPRLASVKRGEKRKIYAYVKCDRICLNTAILQQKMCDICIMPNLSDSLDKYLAYVGREGEYVFPEPQPEPVVEPDVPEEKDRPLPDKCDNVSPHKGSSSLGWSTDCSSNCSMLSEVVDFYCPTTRDFAVKLAAASPGNYNFGQICAIFDRLYNQWRYVNDPSGAEYVAKASETIASTVLVGDCDDYAVCMAACIISIGGNARINTAYGPRGGHAFTEVDVTGLSESTLRSAIVKMFPQYSIGKMHTRTENGRTWLNLDWQAGYPGGPYFEYNEITTYHRVSGHDWKCR